MVVKGRKGIGKLLEKAAGQSASFIYGDIEFNRESN